MRSERPALAVLLAALVVGLAAPASASPGQVRGSKHDLSTTGGSASRASSETQVCVFCHTPHHANPAPQLWNRQASAATYTAYGSSSFASGTIPGTFNTFPGKSAQQPTGSAKLCLSCHDGTIALGATINNGTIAMSGTGFVPATANLGFDLSNDHPVSFVRAAGATQVVNPPTGDPVRLESGTAYVQCLSCHDPHNQNGDPTTGKFLVKSNQRSAICTTCHSKSGSGWSWAASEHSTSTKTYTSVNTGGVAGLGAHTGYTTVANNGCESCHRAHSAPQAQRLLKAINQRNVCFQCHGSAPVAAKNMATPFAKTYRHPLETSTVATLHDAMEVTTSPVNFSGARRHVVCSDCHNPHAAGGSLHAEGGTSTGVIAANSMLSGVRGVVPPNVARGSSFPMPTAAQTGYGITSSATYEYEICFKCHSSYAYGSSPPNPTPSGGPGTDQFAEFNPNNLGYHPVMGPPHLRITQVSAVLKAPWNTTTAATRMLCSDCHWNNETVSATVPGGPHGSTNPYLRRYTDSTWTTTAPTLNSNNGLCANCHNYTQLITSTYGRSVHSRSNHRSVSCQTCHSATPHGNFRVGMIALRTDPSPYNLGANRVTAFTARPAGSNYQESDCTTSTGTPSCH